MLIAIVEMSGDGNCAVEDTLMRSGYAYEKFQTSREFMSELDQTIFDLVIVKCDSVDPQLVTFIQAFRTRVGQCVPLVVSSESGLEADVESSIGAGANECISREVSKDGLLSSIAAWLRWAHFNTTKEKRIRIGSYQICTPQRSIQVRDHEIRLTEKEFGVATALLMNVGRVLSRDHICNLVWGVQLASLSRRIDTHVAKLRSKLLLDGEHGLQLLTIYGIGYRLTMVDR